MKIFNANIYLGKGSYGLGWVEVLNGKVANVGFDIPDTMDGDLDAKGGTLVAGFIDAHTHIGIMEDGLDFEGDDCNEQSDPCTPHLRAIDGINPFDRCFNEAINRGITTAIVSPGSANPIGGQIVAIKTVGKCIDDMVIKTVAIKFALGENPKRVYNDRDETPMTRMATVGIIREALFKAKRYMQDVDKHNNNPEDYDLPEFDIKLESLIPLLRREIKAHFHCHRADDICTAIRITKEFNLDSVIVHGTDGYMVSDIIAREGIPVVCGPIICDRCKPEMKGLDVKNPSVLVDSGVNVAICTDHSVIPIQYLPTSVLMAIKGGLDTSIAMDTITCNSAHIIGIQDRVGSIKVGLDADLQLYDSNPLDVLSEPILVMVDGVVVKDTMV